MATWQGMTWQRELFGPGLEDYDPYAPVRSRQPAPPPVPAVLPPLAPLPPVAQPVAQRVQPPAPSRSDQATRLAQDIAYGHSDWERAGQAVLGSGKFEDASGLRRAGAVVGGAALGTLALASWIPGFNVFKPAQAARAARAFGQGAATGARAGTGIVRGGMDEARTLEQARRTAAAAERASKSGTIAASRGRDMVEDLTQERRAFYDYQYTLPQERLAEIPPHYRRVQEVLHRQGFDGLPQRISTKDFARFSDQGHTPIYRGFWDGDPNAAASWAESTISGPMRIHGGLYGDGIYVATDPAYALSYASPPGGMHGNSAGQLIRGFIDKDAKLLVQPTPGQLGSPEFYAVIEAFQASQGRAGSLTGTVLDIGSDQKLLFSEFLAALGYDGLRVPSTGEILIFNRTATAWQSPVSVPSSIYNESYTSVDRAKEIIERLYRGENFGAPRDMPPRPGRLVPFDYPSQTGL